MYVYNEELPSGTTPPHYQLFKQGDGFSVYTCKTKSTRNPLYRWVVGDGSVNEFAFSPCSKYLAVVSQDGYLRVFNYNTMELVGAMKSYFGALLCVCWSPDSKYLVVGGEDDLVTVWSCHERRVVCRGQGHKSWVSIVAFDPYTTSIGDADGYDFSGSDDDVTSHVTNSNHSLLQNTLRASVRSNSSTRSSNRNSVDSKSINITTYRFGSIGQDTYLCLWDLTEDVLRQPMGRSRTSTILMQNSSSSLPPRCNSLPNAQQQPQPNANNVPHKHDKDAASHHVENNSSHHHTTVSTSFTYKFATLALGDRKDKENHDKKEHKRNFSLASRNSEKVSILKANHVKPLDDSIRLLGTAACPKLSDVHLLEPLICKKIAHERLTSLTFKEDCLVTACQEGFVCTWARPGKVVSLCS